MESAQGMSTREVLACDESFFTALLAADLELLGTILADDFLIIDVLSGQVAHREELLGAISSGQLRFAEVTRHAGERSVRRRASAAVVAGWTRMVVRYRGDEVTVQSRYTHVYTRENGRWRLMSAQGTPTRPPRMNAGREPLFCDTALAGRIERVEVQLIAQSSEAARRRAGTAGFAIPVAGGVASFAGEGSPYNKVAGLGFGGVPDSAALDEIEKAFADCGAPVQVELAHLADPAIGVLLAGRGYRLESFENVLGRALTGEHGAAPRLEHPPPSRSAVTRTSGAPKVCCVVVIGAVVQGTRRRGNPSSDAGVGFSGCPRKRCSSSRAFRLITPRPAGARTRRSTRPRRASPWRRCSMS